MRFTTGKPSGDTQIRFAFQGDTGDFKQATRDFNFSGKERESVVLTPGKPARRVILVGLGEKKRFTPETLRRAAAIAALRVRALDLADVSMVIPPGDRYENTVAAVEGFALQLYEYKRFKSAPGKPRKLKTVRVDGDAEGVRQGDVYSRAACVARDLVNEPPSSCTPRRMAEAARKISKGGVRIKVLDEKQIKKMGMGGVMGVSIGSAEPPRFVHMSYTSPRARKSIAIVGKGITFDSGGLCLKPADGMLNMKDDMSGAAAVIGVMSALPELRPRVNVHGIFAASENMTGGAAYKTRDVLTALNGKTMEIINTDAEGRLILADALSYASRLKPDAIIDMATLTGACVVALGMDITGIFTKNARLQKALEEASDLEGEKIWPLPLDDDYKALIRGDVGDIKNTGGRWAGSITAGLFLQEFVEPGIPWAHLDIAGPAFVEGSAGKPYRPAGGTGVMVRTLLRYLEEL